MVRSVLVAASVLVSLLASCTSTEQASGDFLLLGVGGGLGYERFEIRENRILHSGVNARGEVERKKSKRLSDEEVADCWHAMESQDIFSWLPEYTFAKPDGRPDCGYTSWSLHARRGAKSVETGGYGAFPHDANPKRTKEHNGSERFERVSQALSRLAPELRSR